jgi:hypothetical protein
VELVCVAVVAGSDVLEVAAGRIGVDESAGAVGVSGAAVELSCSEGAESFDNLACVFGCAAAGVEIDFESLTSGKLCRSNVLRTTTGLRSAVAGTDVVPSVAEVVPDAVPDAFPDVVPVGIPEACGVGSVEVVDSRVAVSSGAGVVSGRKVMDVVNGSSRRGGSSGGVTACGTNGLEAGALARVAAELAGSLDDVASESFCFLCGSA